MSDYTPDQWRAWGDSQESAYGKGTLSAKLARAHADLLERYAELKGREAAAMDSLGIIASLDTTRYSASQVCGFAAEDYKRISKDFPKEGT